MFTLAIFTICFFLQIIHSILRICLFIFTSFYDYYHYYLNFLVDSDAATAAATTSTATTPATTSVNVQDDDDDDEPDPDATLFVKNLNFSTVDDMLKEHFIECGSVFTATVAKKKDPKNPGQVLSMGYGFVQFRHKKAADTALKTLQHSNLDGHVIELKVEYIFHYVYIIYVY